MCIRDSVQFAPGGPVEQMIAELKGKGDTIARMNSEGGHEASGPMENGTYRGRRGLDPVFVADIRKLFGFDKPPLERFGLMLKGYLTFDFGRSFFRDKPVLTLIGGEDAGQRLARAVVDAAGVFRVNPAGVSPRRCATAAASIWSAALPC